MNQELLNSAFVANELLKQLNPIFIAIFIFGITTGALFFSGLFRFLSNFLDNVLPHSVVYISDLGEKTELYRYRKIYYTPEKFRSLFPKKISEG